MRKKVFLWYLLLTILFFGMLIKLEYATDTYSVFNFDKEAVFMQYAMSGRFITAVVLKFLKIANFSEYAFYLSSYILAIICATISQYKLYTTIGEDVENKALKIIIPTLIIINPFSIELFLFIEKGLMWLGILMCVLAVENFQKYFELKKIKNLLYSTVFMLVATCLYQGVVGIFLAIAFVFVLKYSKDIKQLVLNNFIAGLIYGVPAVADFLAIKILFKTSRINGQIVFLDSIKKVGKNTINMFLTTYNLLPKYTFILLILFTFAVFCSKIWKEKQKILPIFIFIYIVIGVLFSALVTQIVQPTNSIWFVPRSTYCFGALYGILILFLAINCRLEEISKNIIVIISIVMIIFQVQKFISIENDRFRLNEKDYKVTMQIIDQIEHYEEQTKNRITEIAWYQDAKPNYTYDGVFATGDMNVKAYSSDWSTVEILKYYLKRDIKLAEKDENMEDILKRKNWDEFDEKQIIFEGNKMNLCNY